MSVGFFCFEWGGREQHAEASKKRERRMAGWRERTLARLWAGGGPERSSQSLVIPLLLM